MSKELMQMALDALEEYEHHTDDQTGVAIAALRAELAKPEPTPIGFVSPEFIWDNQAAGAEGANLVK